MMTNVLVVGGKLVRFNQVSNLMTKTAIKKNNLPRGYAPWYVKLEFNL